MMNTRRRSLTRVGMKPFHCEGGDHIRAEGGGCARRTAPRGECRSGKWADRNMVGNSSLEHDPGQDGRITAASSMIAGAGQEGLVDPDCEGTEA